ncbi:hypothetical protein [Thermococcus piezophilus]|nr:hypothetical protein [Thermococcus piezophilus]
MRCVLNYGPPLVGGFGDIVVVGYYPNDGHLDAVLEEVYYIVDIW